MFVVATKGFSLYKSKFASVSQQRTRSTALQIKAKSAATATTMQYFALLTLIPLVAASPVNNYNNYGSGAGAQPNSPWHYPLPSIFPSFFYPPYFGLPMPTADQGTGES